MKPRNFEYAAIAMAMLGMHILTGCGQGSPPLPPGVAGPVGPGGGCIPLAGAPAMPTSGGYYPSSGGVPLPISFTGAQFTSYNRHITAGVVPNGTVPTTGFPTSGMGAGQVIMGGAGPVPTTPMPGSYGTSNQWTGMDSYGGGSIQISFQPATMPAGGTTYGGYGGYNPYVDQYGLPTQSGPVNGGGVVTLSPIGIQNIQQMVMSMQGGNYGPYSQPTIWPNQPGYTPTAPVAPIAPQSVCISQIAFSAAIYAGLNQPPRLTLGDVWIYVNNSGHGLRMRLY